MSLNMTKIQNAVKKYRDSLHDTYKVKSIGIFGSVARNQNTNISDVDVLVDFFEPVGFFKFIELEEYLSNIIGRKVDLVTKKALKQSIKKDILQEVVYV